MYGPKELGFWSGHADSVSKPLVFGVDYIVIRPFVDFDGDAHPLGERWRFVGCSFAPYDNGLSLFVQTADGEWHIRLQLDAERQGAVWDHFDQYVRPATTG
jgi:hypothetical protein